MKSLSVKQAQKWLERIKQADPSAFRQLGKCLRKFDQTSDELECFVKMNQALFPLPSLAHQINIYMEEGNKFIVNKSLEQRLNTFLDIVRNTKHDLFKEIVDLVGKIAIENKKAQIPNQEATQLIKAGILNIVKDVPSLVAQVQKIIPETQNQAIKKLDLKHLKNKVIPFQQKNDYDYLKIIQAKKIKKPIYESQIQKPAKQHFKFKNIIPPTFLNVGQQKTFLKQLQRKVGTFYYEEIMKILQLYHKNIISRAQLAKLVEPIVDEQILGLKDIISSRQMDRRKTSTFKPLSDIDFHILPRQTHSYVQMPRNYPHFAANRTAQHMQILNNNWVSVPRGSEVIFNVRIKNLYELALNKCEDERYQFDLVMKRLNKISQLFQDIIQQLKKDENTNVNYLIKDAISLGVIQLLYKNTTKQQKQIFEDSLYKNTYITVNIFRQRIIKVIEEFQDCRKIYAVKTWNEVSHKNFHKSLDFKNHDFKNNQKFRMKPQSFIDQLNNNVKFLQSRGTKRINDNPFDQKTQFFSIINSFETSSKKQRCFQRKLPTPKTYNIKQSRFPTLLPAMIMAFEDRQILSLVYKFVTFYIEYAFTNQGQKNRSKFIFKQITKRIFRLKQIKTGDLRQNFDEQFFYSKLSTKQIFQINTSGWTQQFQQFINQSDNQNQDYQQIINFNSINDQTSQYSFEPPKNNKNIVFYASQNFYVFLRFFYALYERVIRMRQVVKSEKKLHVFQMLYYLNIKTKESLKFQENLNIIFNQYGYLFSTFYKIMEGVCKSLSFISLSPLQNHSLNLLSNQNQQVYLLLLNRYMLNLQTSPNRLIRVIYEYQTHILYINSFNPYYRFTQQNLKEHNKKRLQISRNVQQFNQAPSGISKYNIPNQGNLLSASRQEYYFQNISSRLVNIACYQDLIVGNKSGVLINKQFQKLKKVRNKYNL